MAVDFTPTMKEYTNQGKFRYWVQMVLPTIYDDSLSYMELLNKVVYALNLAVEDVDAVEDNVAALLTAFQDLQQYTNDYFDNLDVQEEIYDKLDEMAASGELNELLDGYFNVLKDVLEPMAKRGITSSYNYEALTEIGECEIPEGHTCQGSELLGDYLYLAHHLSDTANMYISKYEYPTLTLVETIELPQNIHGNGLTKAPNGRLMLTDARTYSFYFIDVETFSYVDKYTYTGGAISAACFNHANNMLAVNPPTHCKPTYYQKVNFKENIFVQTYVAHATSKTNSAVQDISGSNTFVYFLCSATENTKKYTPNFIRMIGWNGVHFKDIYLPPDLPELEGITRITERSAFMISDVNGKIYEFNGADGIIASSQWNNAVVSYDVDLSLGVNSDLAKDYAIHTINGRRYRLDFRVPFICNRVGPNTIGDLASRMGVYGGSFIMAGMVAPLVNNHVNSFVLSCVEPRTNATFVLGYVYDQENGYLTLNSYSITYFTTSNQRKYVIKAPLQNSTSQEVVEMFATDIETLLTDTGVASLQNGNFYFCRAMGSPNFISPSQMAIEIK